MSLDVHEIAAMRVRRGSPEMAKPDVVKRSGRLEAGDMAAGPGRFLVGTQNDRNRVPANDGADAVLDGAIPARALLPLGRDRIDVGGIERERRGDPGALRLVGQFFEQKCRPVGALMM